MSVSPEWAGPRSLLELWHPTGRPARTLTLGGAAPATGAPTESGRLDFAVIAPLGAEASARWLEQAIVRVSARLEPQGVLCVTVPRARRHDAERLVRRAGLTPIDAVLVVPPAPKCAHVLSLAGAALRYAATRDLGLPPVAAGSAAAVVRTATGRTLAGRLAPGCALLAARCPEIDPLRWLAALDGVPSRCAAAATVGVRRDEPVAVVVRFAAGDRVPDLVAKVALCASGRRRIEREHAALEALGDRARNAGAGIAATVTAPTQARGVLATSALPGCPASVLLARKPTRATQILSAVFAWLRRWNEATRSSAPASAERLHRLLVAPAVRLADVAGGAALGRYVAALGSLADRLTDRTLVLTAAHNDLTMSNVLVADSGLSIVDWESASAAAPPLGDLWYALADGVARAGRFSHAQAVAALARRGGPVPGALAAAPDQRAREMALTPDEALLSFHACWLHHADNELDRDVREGPFRAVVEAVAASGMRWPTSTNDGRR